MEGNEQKITKEEALQVEAGCFIYRSYIHLIDPSIYLFVYLFILSIN